VVPADGDYRITDCMTVTASGEHESVNPLFKGSGSQTVGCAPHVGRRGIAGGARVKCGELHIFQKYVDISTLRLRH